jgi:hypothetical protein
MKNYLVFTTDLALAPLSGENPRGGKLDDFDELDEARDFAELQKDKWDRVFIFKRAIKGELERIEHYQNGQRYVGNQRVRNS